MSRTYRGSKAPGWEHWGNLRERQEQAADCKISEWKDSMTIDKSKWRITENEYLMGRAVHYPLTATEKQNMEKLLIAVNLLRDLYNKPMKVSSGYRPGVYNKAADGANRSCHLTCEAIDLQDTDRLLTAWLLTNLDILEDAGLYMEDNKSTPTWVHLQIRAPRSGKRIFIP